MSRILSLFIILSTSTLLSMAVIPKKVVNHGRDFMLNRPTVISADNTTARESLTKLITNAGGNLRKHIIINSKITATKVRSINGVTEADAFEILVTPRKITIHYTSQTALNTALLQFEELIDNGRIIGRNITDWNRLPINRQGIINCSSTLLTTAQIESAIKSSRARQVFIELADSVNWRIQTDVFKLANPSQSIYNTDGHYNHKMIAAIIAKAELNKITVIPMIELLTPNIAFERVTGHSQFSVEGMRFVRAIIEELARELKCKAICLGTKSEKADTRYIQFIEEIAANNNIELIIN